MSFLGSEGEQADDLSTGSTPTGNVEGSFAFIVSCGDGLFIQANRIHAHIGKSMCVCLSFRCKPMMWQSSMLISLLVLALGQIIVDIWVSYDISYRGPITFLEPLVVLISCHKNSHDVWKEGFFIFLISKFGITCVFTLSIFAIFAPSLNFSLARRCSS